jgi:hydroxymethylpyrimidine pyrophosphatase-like HAD family hydrolase
MTPIKLFCSDLDGTLLGNPESTRRFKGVWESLPAASRPLLCYATGRLVQDVIDLLAVKSLPWPDYIIGGVGTQIYDGRQKRALGEYNKLFVEGWDLKKIEPILSTFPGVTKQPPQFLHPYKSSWYLHQATPETIEQLKQLLAKDGLEVNVVYSSMRDLDVLPLKTHKGYALQWLCG